MLLVLAMVAPVTLPAGLAGPAGGEDAAATSFSTAEDAGEVDCVYRYVDGIGPACRQGELWRVQHSDGSTGYTHGGDPPFDEGGTDPDASGATGVGLATATDPPVCADDPTTGYYAHVIYARAHDGADRYATVEPQLRDLVEQANALLVQEASPYGTSVEYRVHCTDGTMTISNAVLPTSWALASFSTIVGDLRNAGYDSHRVKYWVYYDDRGACTCAGMGHLYDDDRAHTDNLNNGPSNAVSMFAVSFGYLDHRVLMHENAHTMGAVQDSSPHASQAGHCTDGQDIMCYDDGGPGGPYDPNICTDREYFDCNHDDYFHPAPPSGSYLASHWNIAHDRNRFVAVNAGNEAPTMQLLTCSPQPARPGTTVTCDVRATDDSTGIHYDIDWGDGSTTRVPATGELTPGTQASADHAWSTQGQYIVAATATDNGVPIRTSPALTVTQDIVDNAAPVVQSLACTPAPSHPGEQVTCTFEASDDSTGIHYTLDWGDGTSTRVPGSGTVAPSTAQSAQHTYDTAANVTLTLTATDDEEAPLSSTPASIAHEVVVDQAPTMTSLSCSPSETPEGRSVTCSFQATDDSTGIHYDIDWGDGTTQRVPSTGTVAPGTTSSAPHAWSVADTYVITVTATDTATEPGTSAPFTADVVVNPNQAPVMDRLACTPAEPVAGEPVTCTFRAQDDSVRVHYDVDWGDGMTTRVPATGGALAGREQSAEHTWQAAGEQDVSVTATDNAPDPATSAPRAVAVPVAEPHCALERSNMVLAGTGRTNGGSASTRTETGLPPDCYGAPFTLNGSPGADFDVCWYDAEGYGLGCHQTAGNEAGLVPVGASSARITLVLGAVATYTLTASR